MSEAMDRIVAIRKVAAVNRWLGIWKWRNEDKDWHIMKRIYPFVLHLPLTFTYAALMWIEVFRSEDVAQAGNVLYMALTILVMLIKILNIWYRRQEAAQFIDELDRHEMYKLLRSDEIVFWQREQKTFQRIFYTYIGGTSVVGLTGYLSVLYQDTYELPFSYYVPFEWQNPQRYFYAWSYNVLAMTLSCLSNCLLDTMGCYFMFHIGLLYRLLNRRLLALRETSEVKAIPELRHIFQLHRRLRTLTKQCEILVSPYVVSQFVLSALIICFSFYRLVQMGKSNPGVFATTLQFVGVMIVQIFLPCYYGNELTFSAHQLTNSVFNTNWLEYSVATRKILNCYMEFLKRPVKLRAGMFFEIGLPIFMKTINNAYSFLALLINLSK
ncbi:odorant receptor 94b [Drosophila hydei]|uniref:Odorant receptor n=1 Tax=Drosophila hydei TaxID=7224 RepID=A0A6J2SZT3_DROHY|nr:odorant receptor 94b [Drosophila hydei]